MDFKIAVLAGDGIGLATIIFCGFISLCIV